MQNQDAQTAQADGPGTQSHTMKTTKRGRPYFKDTCDLFATLITSMGLGSNKQFFKTYHNSFSTDDAVAHLSNLKFAQSNRGPDPRDPTRIVTTTTTTTFSMSRDIAKAMAQHFMDARLIENAADPTINLFKDRAVYQLTPKGLHVLERFVFKNGMNSDSLHPVFQAQPICMKLLHLERRKEDDEIIASHSVIGSLFRRFVGRQPNMTSDRPQVDPNILYADKAKGMQLFEWVDRNLGNSRSGAQIHPHCFSAVAALEWLCDFTTVVGRDEAAEMAAHFVRFGFIALINDRRRGNDAAVVFTVRGTPGPNVAAQGEFRCTNKAVYRITDEGYKLARWEMIPRGQLSRAGHSSQDVSSSTTRESQEKHIDGLDDDSANGIRETQQKSNAERLQHILNEPSLRSLFREFLRSNFCEENLSFWLDVQDFKKKFSTTSSSNSAAALQRTGRSPQTQVAMERHHDQLITAAFTIYNTYIAPSSPSELNIDHALRNEFVGYLTDIVTGLSGKGFKGYLDPEQARTVNATQLQQMIRLYERIQAHVFRLMATDSVPKFVKTTSFTQLLDMVEDFDIVDETSLGPTLPPGLDNEEVGRTFITTSQAANEKILLAQNFLRDA